MYDWFADAAMRFPTAIALEHRGIQLSYADLERASSHVAARLAARAGPRHPVGLWADRTLTAYVGYLAIQRLGCVAVPLSPSWPAMRVALVARLSGTDLVVAGTDSTGLPECPLRIDHSEISAGLDTPPPRLPTPDLTGDDIAYVLFTSGSTGTPKGVPIKHQNVSAYLSYVIPRYGLGPGSRVSQTFDLAFDLSVFDLFASWGAGATLVVPERRELSNPAGFVTGHEITHWFSVPSVISIATQLKLLAPASMPCLRWSLFCGEQLAVAHARRWQLAAPRSVVENLYGPTELTLSCTQFRMPSVHQPLPSNASHTVPIGTPYPAHEVLIIDDQGRPSETGELCVRGPQRFDGYLDPTADHGRFVELVNGRAVTTGRTPVGKGAWYRTGDLVRRDDGVLTHLGRLDSQVKVLGHRVELGEIEAVIRDQPGVVDVVALVDHAAQGEQVLRAAYTGQELDEQVMARALQDRLPHYMVPTSVTYLSRMPLNPNGKVDHGEVTRRIAGRR